MSWRRVCGSGNPQAIDVQLLAVREVPTLGNTSRSRVEACAPHYRNLPRSGLAHAVGMHRASGEPGDEIDPDLLVRHCEDHVAVAAYIGTCRLVELSYGVAKNLRSTDRVALRVNGPDERLRRNVLDRLRNFLHIDTNR